MKRSLIKVTRCYGKGTRMDIDQKIQQLRNDYVENLGPQDDAYTLKVLSTRVRMHMNGSSARFVMMHPWSVV